jgi:hypothetical protein
MMRKTPARSPRSQVPKQPYHTADISEKTSVWLGPAGNSCFHISEPVDDDRTWLSGCT